MESIYTDQENTSAQEAQMMDILYKDVYRIDSYIAQLINGTLRSVKTQETSSQGSSRAAEASVKVLKGKNESNELMSRLIEKNIDPHDHNVIDLMSILDLPVRESLPDGPDGKLVHLRGSISIRDFKMITELAPVMAKNADVFHIDKAQARESGKLLAAMEKIVPFGLELELTLADQNIVRGTLQESSMLMDYRNILATYGAHPSGIWDVVGIMAHVSHIHTIQPNTFRGSIDLLAKAAEQILQTGSSNFNIIPILIFKQITK